jgi:hypothetical protein
MRIYEARTDETTASIDLLQAIFERRFALQLNRSDDSFFDPDCVRPGSELTLRGIYDCRIGNVERLVRLLHPRFHLEVRETVCQLDSESVPLAYSASLTTGGLGKAFA